MKRRIPAGIVVAACCLAAAGVTRGSLAHEQAPPSAEQAPPGLKLETLLSAVLEGVDGTEVIVSRVTMPPHTRLPKHRHPGEEFAYVLEGSVILRQDGKEDMVGKPGDVMTVPLEQVHTAITTDAGAVILVFRVHEQGKPERVLVD